MFHSPKKLFEIFSAHWTAVFLLAEHNGIIEIENDSTIRALEKAQLEFIEPNGFEQNDHVMSARLPQDP
jgi:hypothetical protein